MNLGKNALPSFLKSLPAGVLAGAAIALVQHFFPHCPSWLCGDAGLVVALTAWGTSADKGTPATFS